MNACASRGAEAVCRLHACRSITAIVASRPMADRSSLFNARCGGAPLFQPERCMLGGWSSSVITGPQLDRAPLGYLPIAKAGSTYLRAFLAPAMGYAYDPRTDRRCLPVSEWAAIAVRAGHASAVSVTNATRQTRANTGGGGDKAGNARERCHYVQGGVFADHKLAARDVPAAVRNGLRVFSFTSEPLRRLVHGVATTLSMSQRTGSPNASAVLGHLLRAVDQMHACLPAERVHGTDTSPSTPQTNTSDKGPPPPPSTSRDPTATAPSWTAQPLHSQPPVFIDEHIVPQACVLPIVCMLSMCYILVYVAHARTHARTRAHTH